MAVTKNIYTFATAKVKRDIKGVLVQLVKRAEYHFCMLSVGVVSRYESILIVVIPHQGQDIAAALLDTFVAPALAAYGHVSVVSADFDLGTLADKIALSVYACVENPQDNAAADENYQQ